MTRQFVLIDSSISGAGGHYLEYAARVMDAAVRLGFAGTVLGNIGFRSREERPWRVVPVFPCDFWGNRTLDPRQRNAMTARDRKELRVRFSRLGLLWSAASQARVYQHYNDGFPVPEGMACRVRELCRRRPAVLRARERARVIDPSMGSERVTGRSHDHADLLAELLDARAVDGDPPPSIAEDVQVVDATFRSRQHRTAYAAALAAHLPDLKLAPEDVVFAPTIAFAELAGLLDVIDRHPGLALPTWHLLFRRDLYRGYHDGFDQQEWGAHGIRTAFAIAASSHASGQFRWYTDTEPLTVQYGRVDACRFTTAPIPVDPVHVRSAGIPARDQPIEFIYLGDARREKGFHLLPMVIDAVRAKAKADPAAARVRFTIQSYLPSGSTDLEMMRVAALIGARAGRDLRVVEGPLDSAAYRARLASAGAVLIPYQRDNYIARSSGIFTEGLAAGLPVVVSGGTWMSGIVDAATSAIHDRACQGAAIQATVTADEIPWRRHAGGANDHHNPEGGSDGVVVAPGVTNYAIFTIPAGATHARIRLRLESPWSDNGVFLHGAWRDEAWQELMGHHRLLGPVAAGIPLSVALPVVAGAADLWLGLTVGCFNRDVTVAELVVEWLRPENPCAPAGFGETFDAEGDSATVATALADAIVSTARHYEALREAAQRNASQWAERHSGEALVRQLMAEAARPPVRGPVSFAAAEWTHI